MSTHGSGHVLVVDDQDNWRLALTVLLESENLHVSQARSFEEAKAALSQSDFDVIVLDVRLVDEDIFNVEGLELLRLIRIKQPFARIIILTGYPDSIKQKPEADDFIFKVPEGSTFDSAGFKNRVRELLEKCTIEKTREQGDHT